MHNTTVSQRLQTSADINDCNQDHPQNLMDWSLARDTPLVNVPCIYDPWHPDYARIRIVIRIIPQIYSIGTRRTSGKSFMQIR